MGIIWSFIADFTALFFLKHLLEKTVNSDIKYL